MCGITGFFEQSSHSEATVLKKMVNKLNHRGPDAQGYWIERVENCQVGLGHTRLSILDISNHANQPMTFEHLVLVYNGEVYNFASIKKNLINLGYIFLTNSDTEVILKAFHQWGIKALTYFRGMFSFCIVDKYQQKAYLVRDRVGVKPFYYAYYSQQLLFASELKSLKAHPHYQTQIHSQGLQSFLQYGYLSAPDTIFSQTHKIPPGHYLEYDLKNHAVQLTQYWNLSTYYHLPKMEIDEEEATFRLDHLLKEAFSLRMVADVPVGVLLSGGIDSSLVAAMLQAHHEQKINTFTMAFDQTPFNEAPYAKAIATYLQTNHHEKTCTWQDAKRVIEQLPIMYDEPFADSSAIPTALISEFARQKVAVILSGDGGDELFCGYSSYALNEKRFKKMQHLPLKAGLAYLLKCVPDPISFLYQKQPALYNRYLKLKSSLSYQNIEENYQTITQIFMPAEMNVLLQQYQPILHSHAINENLHLLERMMLIDFNRYLPDDIMVKVDRASMFYSLEGREPLLDHTILEFAAQLPVDFKKNKSILKKVLKKYLPETYFERKKQGFGVPVNQWLKKELKPILDCYMDKQKIKRQGIFHSDYIEKLRKIFLQTNVNDNKIWTLLSFQMWYETHCNDAF